MGTEAVLVALDLTNAGSNRDIVEAVIFALTRPHHVNLPITLRVDDGGQFQHLGQG